MTLSYHIATLHDLPLIVEIYNSTVASGLVTADTEPVSVESKLNWFHAHNDIYPLWIIKNESAETIGWASFQAFYGRPAYRATAELSIYLSTQHRGKGYGDAVLQYCLEVAPTLGIRTVLGFIFAKNEASMQLFAKHGFTTWGHLPRVAEIKNERIDLCILGLEL